MRSGWQSGRLGNLCQIQTGKKDVNEGNPNGKFPFFTCAAKHTFSDNYSFDTEALLIAGNGDVGQVSYYKGKFEAYQRTYILSDFVGVLPRFLYLILDGKLKDTVSKQKLGNTMPYIKMGMLTDFSVPVPPLLEQQRIVGVLDEAFEGIAAAKVNAKKNLQNARETFESYLYMVFKNPKDNWKRKRWGDLCDFVRGPFGGSLKKSIFKKEGYIVYEQKHAIHDHFNQLRYFIDENKFNEMIRFEVKPGDIIMSCSGVTLGKVAIIPENIKRGIINQALLKLTPKNNVSVYFLKYWLRSKIFQDIIFEYSGGAAIPNVPSAKILKDILIPIPSLEEQKQVVTKLDSLCEETQRLESIYQQKLVALETLKKSLLHQAFTGKLTEQSQESVVVPFPVRIPDISTTDLHAGILAIAFQYHEKRSELKYFGHVKAEKMAHMVEAYVGIDLGRRPVKDPQGPDDYPHLKGVEHRAKMAGFFNFQRVGNGYRVTKLRRFDELIAQTRKKLGDQSKKIDYLFKIMLPMNTRQAEIFSTVYAAWNNLLIDGQQPTDEDIVFEARENWHPDKMLISREKFLKAINWLRTKGIIPNGEGKKVAAKAA